MEYIENNFSSSIDYVTAAQFMNCSEWEFRSFFSFITKIPLVGIYLAETINYGDSG